MSQVVAAQEFLVIFQAVRIIRVVLLEIIPPAVFSGADDRTQCTIAKGLITSEADGFNCGFGTFGYFKNQIDAILRQANELGGNEHVVIAGFLIESQNPLRIALHTRLGKNHPLTDFNFLGQSLIVNLAVAFKIDLIDERIFRQLDNQGAATLEHLHIGKKPGLKQNLD